METPVEPVASVWGQQELVGARPRTGPLDARLAARLLSLALAVGFVGQLLFYGQLLGINVVLASAAVLAAVAAVRPATVRMDRLDLWLPPTALLFAAFLALRSDPSLVGFDLLAALALLGASVAALAGMAVTRRTAAGIVLLGVSTLGAALVGASRLAPGVSALAMAPRRLRGSAVRPLVQGGLIALPFLIVFTILFASADPVFGQMLDLGIRWPADLGDLPVRLVIGGLMAWLAGGLLVMAGGRPASADAEVAGVAAADSSTPEATRRRPLDPTVAGIALSAIDLLFALFVALQAAYLFGGRDTLEAVGMTYSQYARRGFFELLAVAFVAGGLVLVLEGIVARRSRPYTAAAVALCLLTGIVLLSAAVRLGLYQQAYGWTELRFYVLAAIVWLAIGVVAAVVAVLTDRTRWLLHAVGIAALVVAVGVNLIGPQSFVAAANIDRVRRPELVPPDGEAALDADYLGVLGDDAVPYLVEALPSLPEAERRQLRAALLDRRGELARSARPGWPSFNIGRERARQALATITTD